MGWTYNVVDPNVATNALTVAGVGISFTILSLSIVSLRIYVRKCIVKAMNIGKSFWWVSVGKSTDASTQMTGLSWLPGSVA